MSTSKAEDFVLEDSFLDDDVGGDYDQDELVKAGSLRGSLTKRRIIDEKLEERRLQRALRDYDFELDD